MLRRLMLLAAFVTLSSSAFAESGTPQEQAACRRDVRKFCHALKPQDGDEAFHKCLQSHRNELSEACRNVLMGHGE